MTRRQKFIDLLKMFAWALLPPLLHTGLSAGFVRYFEFKEYYPSLFLLDFVLLYGVGLALISLQKRIAWGALSLCLLVAAAQAAAFAKFLILADWVRFQDLFLIQEFFIFYGPWISALILLPLLAIVVVWLLNFRALRLNTAVALPAGLLLSFFTAQAIVNFVVSNSDKSLHLDIPVPLLFGHYGGLIYDGAGQFTRQKRMQQLLALAEPSQQAGDYLADRDPPNLQPRNIHIILVESLIDPHSLTGFSYSRDPFSDDFRALAAASNSQVYSPVTGNRSPDAIFELLCGLSSNIDRQQVIFAQIGHKDLSCLPALLRDRGWQTSAAHPVSPFSFSTGRVYPRFGFDQVIQAPQLDMSDLDGAVLNNGSLFAQNAKFLAEKSDANGPVLNFVFTTSTHYPYSLNAEKRPAVVAVTPDHDLVRAYANNVFYSTGDIAREVGRILDRDNEAIIVILGDHGPPLGADVNFAGGATKSEQSLQQLELPLIVIDGARGALPIGRVPHFALPDIILDLASAGRYCEAYRCQHRQPVSIRPTVDGIFRFPVSGPGHEFCPYRDDTGDDCRQALRQTLGHMREVAKMLAVD